MARVKGTAVLASMRYLRETFGGATVEAILAALPEEERRSIGGDVLVSTWYPMSAFLHLMEEAQRRLQDPKLVWNMGRASAEYSLTTVYRIFFRVGSPEFIISKAARVFGSFYDSGKVVAVESVPGRAAFDLVDFAGAPAFCSRIGGWMERTLELAGAKKVDVVHSECIHRGEVRCRFRGTWT